MTFLHLFIWLTLQWCLLATFLDHHVWSHSSHCLSCHLFCLLRSTVRNLIQLLVYLLMYSLSSCSWSWLRTGTWIVLLIALSLAPRQGLVQAMLRNDQLLSGWTCLTLARHVHKQCFHAIMSIQLQSVGNCQWFPGFWHTWGEFSHSFFEVEVSQRACDFIPKSTSKCLWMNGRAAKYNAALKWKVTASHGGLHSGSCWLHSDTLINCAKIKHLKNRVKPACLPTYNLKRWVEFLKYWVSQKQC